MTTYPNSTQDSTTTPSNSINFYIHALDEIPQPKQRLITSAAEYLNQQQTIEDISIDKEQLTAFGPEILQYIKECM